MSVMMKPDKTLDILNPDEVKYIMKDELIK